MARGALVALAVLALAGLLGRGGVRSGHRAARPGDRQRQGDQRALLGRLRRLRGRLRARSRPRSSSSSSASAAGPGRRSTRGAPDPRQHAARDHLDAHPRARPGRHRGLHLRADPRRRGAPGRRRRGRVRVEAHQFYWQYEYPNGAISLDTLRLPVDTPVALEITAPRRRPQLVGAGADRQAGRASRAEVNDLSFKPQSEGTFEGPVRRVLRRSSTPSCTRRRGRRAGRVRPVGPQRARAGGIRRNSAGRRGTPSCAKCHGFDGEGDIGPPIAGNGTLRTGGRSRDLSVRGSEHATSIEATCLPSGKGWSPPASTRSSRTSSSNRLLRGKRDRRVAVRAEPTRADLEGRPGRQLADDRRPQADRHPLHRHRVRLLLRRPA